MKSLFALVTLLAFLAQGWAHELRLSSAAVEIDRQGNLKVAWQIDLVSYAMPANSGLEAFRNLLRDQQESLLSATLERLRKGVSLSPGSCNLSTTEVPSVDDLLQNAQKSTVVWMGKVDEKQVRLRFPADAGPIELKVSANGQTCAEQLLLPGEETPLLTFTSDSTSAWKYLILGYEHILPLGLDHILFVLGLFLLNQTRGVLLLQVSLFTLAHSITLALAATGIFALPGKIVEPLIAASIAFVAIENILTRRLHAWRLAVVFLFGLVHGMGFAGVLEELGLPKNDFALSLISFNVGVELGQLTVIVLAVLATCFFCRRTWYRSAIVIPASALITCIGLYWTVARIAG